MEIQLARRLQTLVVIGAVGLFLAAGHVLAASSCVRCHTDEAMLKKSLAPRVEKKSSLTSGKG